MKESGSNMDRRGFLKTGIQAAAGLAALGATNSHATLDKKQITATDGIPMRKFGKTGHVLPVLGFGGAAMVDH